MPKAEIKIEGSPCEINIYVNGNHAVWQPYEPGTLDRWSSVEAAQEWADAWVARNIPPDPPQQDPDQVEP